ncbi:unnamed protein product [Owenia fusiformis]|uniref:Neurobeachin-like protein 1 n=1 Tax=Owenia fusiformis TaxID=6347 RepID=A0A8S4P4E4_OWEFU|nr:unnamed protein product [Owenia fusiformis]
MDELNDEENLYQLWMLYTTKNDIQFFKKYLKQFLEVYKDLIDKEGTHLNQGYTAEGPHITRLPDGLLQVITKQLVGCGEQCVQFFIPEALEYAKDLTKCLIVICRNLDNVALVASCAYVSHIVTIATVVMTKLYTQENSEEVTDLTCFIEYSLHFLECMYDPYFVWRKSLRGWKVDKCRFKYKPALLHVEVVPFFYECFQYTNLDLELQLRLFHLFGAIINGSHTNGLRAICPATLDVLLKVLIYNDPNRPSNEQRQTYSDLKQLVLRSLVQMVHVLHMASPDQRQVEVGAVLEGYFQALVKIQSGEDGENNIQLQLKIIRGIDEMLGCNDKTALQVIFVASGAFDIFVDCLHKTMLAGGEAQDLAISIIRVMGSAMQGSDTAKEQFKEKIGYSKFTDALKSLGQPSQDLLKSLLDLITEETFDTSSIATVHNAQAALMLIQWLPDIQSHDLQIWLTECLKVVCSSGNHNRMYCCNEGMVTAILKILKREAQINTQAVGNLISLLESLGSLSISASELKLLLGLLKINEEGKQMPYCGRLMRAMSTMARRTGKDGALHYFDFVQTSSGIAVPGIRKWPGGGFTFHSWICLEKNIENPTSALVRRQLYSFSSSNGGGLEGFFTIDGVLVIAVTIKKEYNAVMLSDVNLADEQWHCVDIVHAGSRRPFGQSQLSVFIDGKMKLTTPFKMPSLTEPFASCRIGSPGLQPWTKEDFTNTPESKSRLSNVKFSLPVLSKSSAGLTPLTTAAGTQDEVWGLPVSLHGQLGSVCVFHEAVTPAQSKGLYIKGANSLNLFQSEDSAILELPAKLLLHYNAKACKENFVVDLSHNDNHGRLKGRHCVTRDIKDVINCVGGLQVLFPLVEQVNSLPACQLSKELIPVRPISPPHSEDAIGDWVVVPSSSYADSKLEQNQVSGILTLLRHMLQSSPVNQDNMVRTNAMATIGALLQKVDSVHIDVNVLMAVQLIVESIAVSNRALLHHIYQYLLFDFRIWSHSEFPVRIGHIQYLSTIIKDDKKFFRKKFGVQYMLDVIRTYYSSIEESDLSQEDAKAIRVSLLGLVKYYIFKEITFEELSQIIAFLTAVKQENLLIEIVDLLITLLEAPSTKDQLFLLMFEPEMVELLYALVVHKQYSMELKEKSLKVFTLLFTSNKVYEKNKGRARLSDVGYSGFYSLMVHQNITLEVAQALMDHITHTDLPGSTSYNALLSLLQLLQGANLDIKLEAARKILALMFAKPEGPVQLAKQLSWQEAITRLFIMQPKTMNASEDDSSSINPAMTVTPCNTPERDLSSSKLSSDSSFSVTMDGKGDRLVENIKRQFSLELNQFPNVVTPAATPMGETPMYFKTRFFDDLDLMDGSNSDSSSLRKSQSRSSSASLEDLSQIGERERQSRGSLTPSTTTPILIDEAFTAAIEDNGANKLESAISEPVENEPRTPPPEQLQSAIKSLGISLSINDETNEKTEELCQTLMIILITIMWKGVSGSDKSAWLQRCQVFSVLQSISHHHDLLLPENEVKRRLLELLLQACIADIHGSDTAIATHTENAMELIKVVYDFLVDSDDPLRYSEMLIDEVCQLLDILAVWNVESEWMEMAHLGCSILLAFTSQRDLNLCAVAAAKLHTILHTRPVDKLQEACFYMGTLDHILTQAQKEGLDNYQFVIPVMKALIEKSYEVLNMSLHLPSLPPTTMSPTFFDDFKSYSKSEEWRTFISKQIKPSMEQFISVNFDETRTAVKMFWSECHEEMMVSGHKRSREKGESKLKFQSRIVEPFRTKGKMEEKRYVNITTQLHNQHASCLRNWRAAKQFFTGERGAWCESGVEINHWKLSPQENFQRMRPKLIPNYTFDNHSEASNLRDNITDEAVSESDFQPPITVSKEAKVSDEEIGDDRLGDEEWNVISAATVKNEDLVGKEKLVLSEDCELVTIMNVIKGRLEVTTTHVYFFDCSLHKEEREGGEDFKWSLSQLREIHFRRYNLRRSALEMFLIDQTNYFLNFQKKVRNKVYSRILSLRPQNLIYYGSRSPVELLKASGLTQKWVNREISNFEYLIQLNTISGRTYNDLSQYPVFPWILADYTSETLDIEDPKVYRDLAKPIGVVNPKNEEEVREKFNNFEDLTGTIEKFHYGTHYSNAAGVMHFLLRLEPFTTLHIQLQSGRFDVADRQFHSIPATWKSLMENPNDVKELIPEFFYTHEFLENHNHFDLGQLQISKTKVNDVILPTWATSPEDFIHKHRQALESEHVSSHLHEWIDLIFGYKQKGPAAAEALNVFYYCTYEGAVDLDAISNPIERKALEGMINNFGQTPCQLLKEPHPKRLLFEDTVNKANKNDKPLSVFHFHQNLKAFFVEVSSETDPIKYVTIPRSQARSFIQHGMPDAMVSVSNEGVVGIHGWLPYDKSISNYFTFERDPSMVTNRAKRKLAGPFAPGMTITSKLFVVSHDAKVLFCGGHWDNSLRVYSLVKSKTVCHAVRHTDVITCLALDYCGNHLITGSRDTTSMIWQITNQNNVTTGVVEKPIQTLYGHDDEVSCVALSIELDLAVSGSKDGTIMLHTVRKGHYMRTLRPHCERGHVMEIDHLALSDVGQIAIVSTQSMPDTPVKENKQFVHVYSINGKYLCMETPSHRVAHMVIADNHIILGTTHGLLAIKELIGLNTLASLPLHVPITCLAVAPNNSHILAALNDGKLIIVGIKKDPQPKYRV